MMLSEVYDIETLINLFTYTGYCRQTKTYHQFVIHKLRNDYEQLIQHLKRDKLIMIGYNNENFDYPIIHHLLNHYEEYRWLNGFELSQKIYEKAQELVNNLFNTISDYNKFIQQIDLFKIHHFDNKAKLTSLKSLEIAMRLSDVEDIPFDHNYWITNEDEINKVLSYNKWDVYSTNCFLDVTLGKTDYSIYSGKNKIELRQILSKKYNLNCLNWNDIKIGTELILKLYCTKTGKNPKEVRQLRTYRPKINLKECIPTWINFKSKEFIDFKNEIENTIITQTKGEFNKSVIFHNMKFYYGTGGIHSSIKPGIYSSDNEWCIIDYDVNSLYPSIAIALNLYPEHLGPEFLEVYDKDIVSVRLSEKEKPKELRDNVIVEGYKLAANGTLIQFNIF